MGRGQGEVSGRSIDSVVVDAFASQNAQSSLVLSLGSPRGLTAGWTHFLSCDSLAQYSI